MSQLLHRPELKQRPSIRLRQRLEILALPRWRLLARAFAMGCVQPLNDEKNQFDWIASEKSREAELLEEMRLNYGYNPQQENILTELIGNLDERGFLADSVEAIAVRLDVSEKEVQSVRHDLQNFENQGVGSLHFVDFLLFQLARAAEERDDPLPRKMFQFFFNVQRSGGAMDFIRVMRRVHRQLDKEFLDYFRSGKIKMSPWPADGETIKCQAFPDVYVSIGDGALRVNIPRDFQDSPEAEIPASEGKDFRALRMAIDLRESTLKRVCECIFTHQMPFLHHGVRALGTLTQKKIADELNLAPSTVSRALADKYVHTPHGTFPLKDLLPTELSSSRLYVNHLIGSIVDKSWENILLSDQKMADCIRENFGTKVPRRVIASIRRITH
jgi:RNA polymerase sigma-54 factor